METESWLEVRVHIANGATGWVGTGFWPAPVSEDHWRAVAVAVVMAVNRCMMGWGYGIARDAFVMEFGVVELAKEISDRIRKRFDKLPVDDHRQITWLPNTTRETRWVAHG